MIKNGVIALLITISTLALVGCSGKDNSKKDHSTINIDIGADVATLDPKWSKICKAPG